MREPFENGCTVRCINASGNGVLWELEKYKVKLTKFYGACIYLEGKIGPFSSERFVVAKPNYDFEFSDGWCHIGKTVQ